jgi:hypothetical protein
VRAAETFAIVTLVADVGGMFDSQGFSGAFGNALTGMASAPAHQRTSEQWQHSRARRHSRMSPHSCGLTKESHKERLPTELLKSAPGVGVDAEGREVSPWDSCHDARHEQGSPKYHHKAAAHNLP